MFAGRPFTIVALVALLPLTGAALAPVALQPQETDLPNGIHLIVLEDHRVPQVTTQVYVQGAGPYDDPPDIPGLAQFTASMMLEGTTTRTARQIAQAQETTASSVSFGIPQGTSFGNGLGSDAAALTIRSPAGRLDTALEIAADVLRNPTFPEEELARFKVRQKASLLQARADPSFLARERYARAVYGDHPSGRVKASPEAVDRVTRADLVAFHRAHYAPDQMIVAVIGDIAATEVRQIVEARLGTWQKSGVALSAVRDPAPPGPPRVHLVDRPNSAQTSLVIGTQAIEHANADYYALQVLTTVIGGLTGRLHQNLREDRGWTYAAYAALNAPRFRGDWSITTGVRGDVTEPAVREILDQLSRLRAEPVPAAELEGHKRAFAAGFAQNLENPFGIVFNRIVARRCGLPADHRETLQERIMAVTAAQVQAAARKYLDPNRLQIVAVGDARAIAEGLKKFGGLQVFDTEGRVKPWP
jgi:zinc protease